MRTSALIVAGAVGALVLLAATGARAAQYPGWGDTGWVYASKRECCNAAIAFANEYSAQACVIAGGVPKGFSGGVQRGTCQPEWSQDEDGYVLYRCYAEASVWCR